MQRLWTWVAPLFVSSLMLTNAASAVELSVTDEGGFFSGQAIQEAQQKLASNSRELRVVVETYPAPPEEVQNAQQLTEVVNKWLEQRKQANQNPAAMIVICKSPGKVGVSLDKQLKSLGMKDSEAKTIRVLMTNAFQQREYDKGLLDAVDYLDKRFSGKSVSTATPAGNQPAAGQMNWLAWVGIGVAILFVVMILMALMRGLGGGGMGGGFGGIFGSLLAGFAGMMAASWMYDTFFGDDAHASEGMGGDEWNGNDVGGFDDGGDFGDFGDF